MDLSWIAEFWAAYVPEWAVALLGLVSAVLFALIVHAIAYRIAGRVLRRRETGTAPAFLRRIRWPTRILLIAFSITAILPALPGNMTVIDTDAGQWMFQIMSIDPDWEILTGEDKGKKCGKPHDPNPDCPPQTQDFDSSSGMLGRSPVLVLLAGVLYVLGVSRRRSTSATTSRVRSGPARPILYCLERSKFTLQR